MGGDLSSYGSCSNLGRKLSLDFPFSVSHNESSASAGVSMFIDQTWSGAKVGEYNFGVPATTPNTWNKIDRTAGITSFDMCINSDQSFADTDIRAWSGDFFVSANVSTFYAIGKVSTVVTSYTHLEYALWAAASGGVVNWYWYELGVLKQTFTTTPQAMKHGWRLEYNGDNEIKVYRNNVLLKTVTTAFSGDTITCKILSRNGSSVVANHMALKSVAQPNKQIMFVGDSITDGLQALGYANRNYPTRIIANLSHTFFANPVVAGSGNRTNECITLQLPCTQLAYNASLDKNIASVMIGYNDLATGSPLATIQSNITTIVSTLQGYGYTVVLYTVTKSFTSDYANRYPLNAWILAGSAGQDHTIDLTQSLLETDSSLFYDNIHPNNEGMQYLADYVWQNYLTY